MVMLARKTSLVLEHNFAHGVVMTPPHGRSHEGQAYHNYQLKEYLLKSVGPETFVDRLRSEWEEFAHGVESFLRIPVFKYTPNNMDQYLLHPDIFYPCDSAITARHGVFFPRMGAKTRADETDFLREFFTSQAQYCECLGRPGKFEGGDALVFQINGKHIAILGKRTRRMSPKGLCVRTNEEGRKAFTRFLYTVYQDRFSGAVTTCTNCLHVGTSCEIIQAGPDEPIWICHNEWLRDPKKLALDLRRMLSLPKGAIRTHQVPREENWAAPVFSHDGKAIVQKDFPETIDWLKWVGFRCLLSNFVHVQATDGNKRCLIQPTPQLAC